MKLAAIMTLGLGLVLTGCSSGGTPAATDTFDQRYVGAWRVVSPEDPTTFSDYDFSDAGKLTQLGAVVHGAIVDPMQGVSTVTGVAGSVCVFAATWYNDSSSSMVVGGDCSDGVARQVDLAFVADTEAADRGVSQVTVKAVDGKTDWMRPAAWQFEHCSEHPCN
jgi:hypothetical protein